MSLFGAFGAHFGVDLGSFWVVLGARGAPFWRSEANLDTCTSKRGAAYFSISLFGPGGEVLATKSGPGSSPGGAQRTRKSAEAARREGEEAMCRENCKTSKTSTLSSEMRVLSGREGPKILKNRPRSGLEGLKNSIVT